MSWYSWRLHIGFTLVAWANQPLMNLFLLFYIRIGARFSEKVHSSCRETAHSSKQAIHKLSACVTKPQIWTLQYLIVIVLIYIIGFAINAFTPLLPFPPLLPRLSWAAEKHKNTAADFSADIQKNALGISSSSGRDAASSIGNNRKHKGQ